MSVGFLEKAPGDLSSMRAMAVYYGAAVLAAWLLCSLCHVEVAADGHFWRPMMVDFPQAVKDVFFYLLGANLVQKATVENGAVAGLVNVIAGRKSE